MEEPKSLPEKLLSFVPWNCSSHSVWLGTSLSLRRNISHFLFPQKLKNAEAFQLRSILKDALSSLKEFEKFYYYPLENINPTEKQLLFEVFQGLSSSYTSSSSEAFVLEPSCKFITTFNMQDHLHMRIEDFDGEWEKSFEKLMQIDDALSKVLSFSYLDKFGYLTASPNHCGTGFEALFYLHLPLLLREKKELSSYFDLPENITLTTLQGDSQEFIGDIVILKNAYCLGINESIALQTLFSSAKKLALAEEEAREKITADIPTDIKDIISRSFGVIQHSFQLKTAETINALSLLKLGLDLGFITGTTQEKLNELFFLSQRAHLSTQHRIDVTDEKRLTQERANLLHKELQKMQHNA